MRFLFLICIFVSPFSRAATPEKNASSNAPVISVAPTHMNRNYPGGRDEEDLKVQDTLVTPTVKTDRRTIESKVLKINSKKVDTDEPEATEQ